jgi:hypothetical protein
MPHAMSKEGSRQCTHAPPTSSLGPENPSMLRHWPKSPDKTASCPSESADQVLRFFQLHHLRCCVGACLSFFVSPHGRTQDSQKMNRQDGSQQAAGQQANLNPQHLTAASIIPARTASAPLPSPTQQRPQYFSSLTTSTMACAATSASSSSSSTSTIFAASSGQNAPQYQQDGQSNVAYQQSATMSSRYVPDRGTAGSTAQETTSYIDNFALVAEAAKRAQMAVLMRDMEGVELT